ncbi:MAG: hypothetical protein ACI9DQ_001153, partial [Glaciecola sp.]
PKGTAFLLVWWSLAGLFDTSASPFGSPVGRSKLLRNVCVTADLLCPMGTTLQVLRVQKRKPLIYLKNIIVSIM